MQVYLLVHPLRYREAAHDFTWKHAGAISLRHSMLIIHFHTEKARTWRSLLDDEPL